MKNITKKQLKVVETAENKLKNTIIKVSNLIKKSGVSVGDIIRYTKDSSTSSLDEGAVHEYGKKEKFIYLVVDQIDYDVDELGIHIMLSGPTCDENGKLNLTVSFDKKYVENVKCESIHDEIWWSEQECKIIGNIIGGNKCLIR